MPDEDMTMLEANAETPAIQEAINSVPQHGGTIYFPRGRYVLNEPLTLKSGVSLQGTGQGVVGAPPSKSVLVAGRDMPALVRTEGPRNSRIKISGLNIDGDNKRLKAAVSLHNTLGSIIQELRIERVNGDGIAISYDRGKVAWTNWLLDSVIRVEGVGLRMGGTDSFIRGLYVSGGKGIRVTGGGNMISGCHVDRSKVGGLTFAGPRRFENIHASVMNCYFDLNKGPGVVFQASKKIKAFATVTGCVFRDNGPCDIQIKNCHDVSLLGNAFSTKNPSSGFSVKIDGDTKYKAFGNVSRRPSQRR